MRRFIIGFALRLIIATLISLSVWWLFTTPFDRIPLPRAVVVMIIRVIDFPVALAGEVLPIRGIELVFDDHDTWCDFCPLGEVFRQQMRLAIPVYVLLLYVPSVIGSIARRNPRLLKPMVIVTSIYVIAVVTYFVSTSTWDRRSEVRVAAICLVTLAAAAAVAWSNLSARMRTIGIAAVLVAGAWAFSLLMNDFVSDLVLLIAGVGGTLALTWGITIGLPRGRETPKMGNSS